METRYFRDDDGVVYFEWHSGKRWGNAELQAKRLTRKQWKTFMRFMLKADQWYVDWRFNDGDIEEYATTQLGRDSKPMTKMRIARWLWSVWL